MITPEKTLPEREGLRRAIYWLLEQPVRDLKSIEAASVRFNLSPIDEEFLLNHFKSCLFEINHGQAPK